MNTPRRPVAEPELIERELAPATVDTAALLALTRAEIDGQIATARAFPRSLQEFADEANHMVTLNAEMAEACIYSLPRKDRTGKKTTITGPSARFAEIMQYAFGNNRGGGRVVAEEGEYIVAQGVFHDLQKNVMVTMEVRRRITDSLGRRYGADMIGVTGNAAAAIAHRNAVLKGIPKALWLPHYEAARGVAVGDIKTIAETRALVFAWFAKVGIDVAQICARLDVHGPEDIGLAEIEVLVGLKTAIRDGADPSDVFAPEAAEPSGRNTTVTGAAGMAEKLVAKRQAAPEPEPAVPGAPAAEPVAEEGPPTPERVRAALEQATTIEDVEIAAAAIADLPPELHAGLYALAEVRQDAIELGGAA